MKKIKAIIKKIDDIPILFLLSIALAIFISMALFILAMYCISLALGEGMSNSFSDTIRNFAWVFSMWATLTGGIVGLRLAWRGRQIQQDQWKTQEKQWKTQDKQWHTQHTSNLQERYEKAADMLSSELISTRIAACLSLADLGKTDESMKSRCVRLLFAFIKNPYLEANKNKEFLYLTGYQREKYLSEIFPANRLLPPDIREATNSFCVIYEHYGMDGVDGGKVELPVYFWINDKKRIISLTKANLIQENLNDAFLVRVKLEDADLRGAYLKKSDLRYAELGGAKLNGVQLQEANLMYANLAGADLDWSFLEKANFFKANLDGAILTRAKLQRAEFQIAKLSNAKLSEAKLADAILWNADLVNADLAHAELAGADLRRAKLDGADLRNAWFSDADISLADLRKAKNLTVKQILSAKWGHSRDKENSGQPQLPEESMQNEDIQRWLENPRYDEREKPKDSG